MLDAFIPRIQRSADEVVLQGIVNESQQSDEAIQFNPSAKRFAFNVASEFIWGPLLNENSP
jgi:hypothetical protein